MEIEATKLIDIMAGVVGEIEEKIDTYWKIRRLIGQVPDRDILLVKDLDIRVEEIGKILE